MTINKFHFLRKISVRISIIFALLVVLVVSIIFLCISDWDCSRLKLSILLRVALACLALIFLFFAYIISPIRNSCCASNRVKFAIIMLKIFAVASIVFSISIDLFCFEKINDNNCEMSEVNGSTSVEMKIESQYTKKLLLVVFSNLQGTSFDEYLLFELSVSEKINYTPICPMKFPK